MQQLKKGNVFEKMENGLERLDTKEGAVDVKYGYFRARKLESRPNGKRFKRGKPEREMSVRVFARDTELRKV